MIDSCGSVHCTLKHSHLGACKLGFSGVTLLYLWKTLDTRADKRMIAFHFRQGNWSRICIVDEFIFNTKNLVRIRMCNCIICYILRQQALQLSSIIS